jgi:hypothetical protein
MLLWAVADRYALLSQRLSQTRGHNFLCDPVYSAEKGRVRVAGLGRRRVSGQAVAGTKRDGIGSCATASESATEMAVGRWVRGSDSGSEDGPALVESCVVAVVDPCCSYVKSSVRRVQQLQRSLSVAED